MGEEALLHINPRNDMQMDLRTSINYVPHWSRLDRCSRGQIRGSEVATNEEGEDGQAQLPAQLSWWRGAGRRGRRALDRGGAVPADEDGEVEQAHPGPRLRWRGGRATDENGAVAGRRMRMRRGGDEACRLWRRGGEEAMRMRRGGDENGVFDCKLD